MEYNCFDKPVHQDIHGLNLQVFFEKDIKVRGASSKEQGLVIRICPNVPGKPSPLIYLKIL